MSKNVLLSIVNQTGFTMNIAGVQILPYGKAPDGQEVLLDPRTAKQAEKEINAYSKPVKAKIIAVADGKEAKAQAAKKLADKEATEAAEAAQKLADAAKKKAAAAKTKPATK